MKSVLFEGKTSKRDKVTPKEILLKWHQCSCGAILKTIQITTSVFRLSSREDSDCCENNCPVV